MHSHQVLKAVWLKGFEISLYALTLKTEYALRIATRIQFIRFSIIQWY